MMAPELGLAARGLIGKVEGGGIPPNRRSDEYWVYGTYSQFPQYRLLIPIWRIDLSDRRLRPELIADPTYHGMWRVQWPDGRVSDLVNLTRAIRKPCLHINMWRYRLRKTHWSASVTMWPNTGYAATVATQRHAIFCFARDRG